MPTLMLDAEIHRFIVEVANAAGITPSALLRQKFNFQVKEAASQMLPPTANGWLRVHYKYKGIVRKAEFNPDTKQVRLLDGRFAGETLKSPSAAAIRVVEEIQPGRKRKQVNGWTAFIVDNTGLDLNSVRRNF